MIFSSWLVENQAQSKWIEEKDNLKRSQLGIDIEEVHRSIYELAYVHE